MTREHPPGMVGKVPFPDRPPSRLALWIYRITQWMKRHSR
jgi:hypothetical protein